MPRVPLNTGSLVRSGSSPVVRIVRGTAGWLSGRRPSASALDDLQREQREALDRARRFIAR
jgi:hypothetical protein